MAKSLEQLRKERDMLLNKSSAMDLQAQKRKKDTLERKKIEAEIKALKSPGKQKLKKSLRSFGKKTRVFGMQAGTFIKKRSDIISANMAQIEREQRKKKIQGPKKKVIKRRRTISRNISRKIRKK